MAPKSILGAPERLYKLSRRIFFCPHGPILPYRDRFGNIRIDSVVPELPLSMNMIYPPYFFLLGVSQLPESAVRLGVSSGAGAPCNDVS